MEWIWVVLLILILVGPLTYGLVKGRSRPPPDTGGYTADQELARRDHVEWRER